MPDLQTADKWHAYAAADLAFAKHGLSMNPVQLEIICYYCQQAGEKALKAILAYHEDVIPKIHDMNRLVSLCAAYEPQILSISAEATRLAKYAVATRYPEELEVVELDMRMALTDAEAILSLVQPFWRT
ncbi:MAG: HEPN domain-containing protein [Oscillospiraceae bacterium]|jgi:HEPN domain-containing protein|nr:HEPN domain-containing protein [Oscillospiraceae bacterium]